MIRRLNSTGRKKLSRDIASISLVYDEKGELYFSGSVVLDEADLPGDAQVYVEAYYRNSYMRFPWGKVSELSSVKRKRFDLTDIQSEYVYFRVKVVDLDGDVGKLLAQADRIQPRLPAETEKSRSSLLGVHFADLGDIIWDLDLDDVGVLPHLDVNDFDDKYPIRDYVGHNASFVGLVFPEVLERIVRHIYDDPPESEDEDSWKYKWMAFVNRLPGITNVPDLDSAVGPDDEWYRNLRQQFSKKLNLKTHFEREVFLGGQ